jgi:hypothetical protein
MIVLQNATERSVANYVALMRPLARKTNCESHKNEQLNSTSITPIPDEIHPDFIRKYDQGSDVHEI